MGAGSSAAALKLSASTVGIYSSLPEHLTKEKCIEVVGKDSTDLLLSYYATKENGSNKSNNNPSLIKREWLLSLPTICLSEKKARAALLPIYYLKYSHFKAAGEFPRYDCSNTSLVYSENIDMSKAFVVFISHMWLRSAEDNKNSSYPDSPGNTHYQLCVDGIELIRQNHTRGINECYLWVDYSCLSQEINPVLGLGAMDTIMSHCDCLFTPVMDTTTEPVETSGEDIIMPEMAAGIMSIAEYKADAWQSYLSRAWTRLEMFYSANIPLSNATLFKSLNGNFNMELNYSISKMNRPHFIFSAKHRAQRRNPVCLSPLPTALFEHYHPLRGMVTKVSDRVKLEQLVQDLLPYMTLVENNVVGFQNASRKKSSKMRKNGQKRGRYVYASNDVYEGYVFGDELLKRQGQGKMTYANGDVYDGAWCNDAKHGEGTMTYANGSIYCGLFAGNKKHGVGKHIAAAAGMELWHYSGDWRDGMKCGQGRLVTVTGEEYEGGFVDDLFSGNGAMKHVDGSTYVGDFFAHKKCGYGRMTYVDGKCYSGDWQNDVHHGEGALEFPGGDCYRGRFEEGMRSGQGTFSFSGGDEYSGMWAGDEMNGLGVFRYADGEVYEGECQGGVKEGKGKYMFSSGSMYEGDWKGGQQHGRGVFRFSGGDVYSGDWVNDMMTGRGVFTYSSGDVYDGDFASDMKCGHGIMTYSDGDVYDGQWHNDQITGRGSMTFSSGSMFVGFWRAGLYHGYGWFIDCRGAESEGLWEDGKPVEERNKYWTSGTARAEDITNICTMALKVRKFCSI